MNKKIFYIISLIMGIGLSGILYAQESQSLIINALKEGNARVISQYFNNAITFSIPGHEGIYSSSQAEGYLKRFFEENKVVSFKVNHQGRSAEGSRFLIGTLSTAKGNFKVYYLMKRMEEKERIIQFQIELIQD